MRILLVADRLSTRGGGDQYWLDLCRVLQSLGHETRLLVGRKEKGLDLSASVFVLRGLARPTPSSARLADLDTHMSWADQVVVQGVMNPVPLERLRASRKAIFVVQDHRHFCPGPGKTLPDGQACEALMSDALCAGCLPEAEYRLRLLELTKSRTSAIANAPVVVLSNYMSTQMRQLGFHDIHVIPPFVDSISTSEPRKQRTGFLLAGRLVPHKAPLRAVLAWRESGTSETLWVAGEGSQLDEMRRMAADASGRMEIVGWLDRTTLLQRMSEVRALLFPGHWQEPFGILGIEALAMGTPVVTDAMGGSGDWSGEGVIRVDWGDLGQWSRAIEQVQCNAQLHVEWGEAGQRAVHAKFSRAEFVGRWQRLLGGLHSM